MIDLPDTPGPQSAEPALMDFGALLVPPLGGPVQRVDRMGNRFRIAVTMPPLRSLEEGRLWVSRLVRGKAEGVRMAFPLQKFNAGSPGAPVVDGAGQAGSVLNLRGATPNYYFAEGQFFSIVTGGRHHLVMAAATVVVGADGKAAVPIAPNLRVQHGDGDLVAVGRPMIEGYVQGDEMMWSMQIGGFTGLSFEIHEAA